MKNIFDLLNDFAEEEAKIQNTTFLAPHLKNGQVWTKVKGMLYKFEVVNRNFEGWGIFKPDDAHKARLVKRASFEQIQEYLQLLPTFRLHLTLKVNKNTWLAYPVNESDAKKRLGKCQPFLVHLITEAQTFEQITAAWNGQSFWYKDIDRKADPFISEDMRTALTSWKLLEEVNLKGLTPELKIVYNLALNHKVSKPQQDWVPPDEKRLRTALKTGGGRLDNFIDKGDYWLVDWRDSQGGHQTSSISKKDLTVISSGICLSGEDEKFDLQSLVAVIENRY